MGRHDEELDAWNAREAIEFYVYWILAYVSALATVKSSICTMILFVTATKPGLRVAVYAMLATTWSSFFVTFFGVIFYCRPMSAMWTRQGTCASVDIFIVLGYVATVTTIITDAALVVVPAIILWDSRMQKKKKLQAFGLLSFAST
jgi:hypothetical protein